MAQAPTNGNLNLIEAKIQLVESVASYLSAKLNQPETLISYYQMPRNGSCRPYLLANLYQPETEAIS